MAKEKWMADAFRPEHAGEFTAKAKKAGMTAQEYAAKVLAHPENYTEHTVNQAKAAKASKSVANKHKRRKLQRRS